MKIVLDAQAAKKLLNALEMNQESVEVSLDLGQSFTDVNLNEAIWDIESIRKISRESNSVYFIENGDYYQAAISTTHYYRLFRSMGSRVPALMIDGVLMHRVKDVDPGKDAQMKARLCAQKGFKMLEICTGLGYSAIACLDKDIQNIITIEKDENVLKLAEINPWSSRLFTDERVKIVNGDALLEILQLKDNQFDGVLHDPPRFSMGSELYTLDFYQEIYRVLKSKGVLYHYVGSPGSKYKKRDIPKGVMTRLREVGFRDVTRRQETLGIIARK
ncbi:MAG: methyltransferase domain-containing protein [Candidatus Thorarchaeota archaeon]|jgi:predicted methyltransferase